MAKMRAVQLFAPSDLRCVEVEKPKIEDKKDVIVKVKACGVCGSDLMRVMVKGAHKHPITIGHEFSGIVDEIGSSEIDLKIGDRVTVVPLVPCGKCDYCKIGQHVLCDNYSYYGSRIDGAMAEYIKVNSNNIIKIPLNVDFESGAMTDPVAVSLHAVRKTKIEPGQTVAVFGLGAIGLITVQWLKYSGCSEIYAIDIFNEKLELAEKLGADMCINAKNENAVEVINNRTNKKGLDIVIELAGSKISQIQAIDSVRKLGRVIFCGISYDDLVIPNSTLSKILRCEIDLKIGDRV
ncbi:MAG: galactitol-1-phosphate 5-dehydrogenase [Actinobacteria bacterium]|nr:galactitol-1-phosphate 5-dehydrogenase [Actinomycetota bacterium]